jgi:hypothetical protein
MDIPYSPHYWYSVEDGFRLVWRLRNQHLRYTNNANEGEEYVSFRENENNILITDPYYINNFDNYLNDDIARITATGSFQGRTSWTHMPTCIIIPFLAGAHWIAIKISINYINRSACLHFHDPYGLDMSENIRAKILPAINSNIEKFFRKKQNEEEFNLKFTFNEIDQQGCGENFWDCGPITFSNIEDYIKCHVSGTSLIYSIPKHDKNSLKIREIRSKDSEIFSSFGEIFNHRLNEIENQIDEVRNKRIEKAKNLEIDVTNLDSFYVSMFFQVLESKRLIIDESNNEEYSKEEIKYALEKSII